MPDYTYEQLDTAVDELKRKAIEKALLAAAIGPNEETGTAPRTPEEHAVAGRIETFFGNVPSLFVPFKPMPEPGPFRDLANHLVTSAQLLSTTQNSVKPVFDIPPVPQDAFTHIESAGDALSHWNGRAAREFKVNYLDPLPIQLAGQFNLIAVASKLMEEEAKIWEQARLNVAEIVNKGINAMDKMDQFCTKNS